MSWSRRPAIVVALSLAGLATGLSGCVIASPATVTKPYTAADGQNGELRLSTGGKVALRNFMVVSAGKDKPGVLLGSVSGVQLPGATEVKIGIEDSSGQPVGEATTISLDATTPVVTFGPEGTAKHVIASVPVAPGSVLALRAVGPQGGTSFTLPVLPPEFVYASITAPASSTDAASASPSASTSPSATAGRSPAASASASATPTTAPTS